ncbi:MAG TPA: ATP-dependent DNA helicase RecG, partial [Phenylobacterium sp.]
MRPEILFPLFAPVSTLKGVGPRVEPLVEKLAGPLVRDMAFLKPHSIVRRTPSSIAAAIEGEVHTFEVTIEAYAKPRSNQQPWRVRCSDATGTLSLVYFGSVGTSLEVRNPVGQRRIVSGKVERYGADLQMVHPDYLVAPDKADTIPELEPIYPASAGLAPRIVRRL